MVKISRDICDPIVGSLDIGSISQSEAKHIRGKEFELKFRNEKDKVIHGLVVYFETFFIGGKQGAVVLTNSPLGDTTHWRHTYCLFEEPISVKVKKRAITGSVTLVVAFPSQAGKIQNILVPNDHPERIRLYLKTS